MTSRAAHARKQYQESDVGNGERLVAEHGRDIRWVSEWKTWIVWDGRRWARDMYGEVERRAKATVRGMLTEAAALSGPERQALAKHALRSESLPRIRAMIESAKSEPGVPISHADLDQLSMKLTVRNGTLDLATGQLGPHERGHLMTKLVDIDYDPDAECPVWLATLRTVLANDEGLLTYVQCAVGYSLTGDTREQCLFICHGSGANGKSTILDVLGHLAGEYGQQADFTTFLERRHDSGPRNDVARLAGARLVRSSEVGEDKRFNEGLIKSLTGGDTITARFLYSEDFEFVPRFKLWLAANDKPQIRGTDYAIWRRVRLIPFLVTIKPEQRDDTLPGKLRSELSGILTWAVDGCQQWLEAGALRAPLAIVEATKAYQSESDIVGAFIADRCELVDGHREAGGVLFKAYQKWATASGDKPMNLTRFGLELNKKAIRGEKIGGVAWRFGLRLLPTAADDKAQDSWFDREAA